MSMFPKPKNYYRGEPDQREIPRIKLATIAPMDSSKWDLELSKPVNAPELEQLLNKYHEENLEENLFFGKQFLAAAFGRMDALETSLITLWETVGDNRYLKMYFPVISQRVGVPGNRIWRCWSHDYAPLGVPCISNSESGEILDRFLQLLALTKSSVFPALVFDDIPLDGYFATRLKEALKASDTPYCQNKIDERAILLPNRFDLNTPLSDLSAKKNRQMQRQLRRLSETGKMKLEKVDRYADVILRFEEFLLLESTGWKGQKGTSIYNIKQTAAFARQAVTDLAKIGQSAIYSIRLNNKSIAALVVLNSNGIYFPWKIAFDPTYARFSPGAVLMYNVSNQIGSTKGFIRADSLASARNTLMNLLWKRRMDIGDFILPIGSTSKTRIEKISAAMNRKRAIRKKLKSHLREKPQ